MYYNFIISITVYILLTSPILSLSDIGQKKNKKIFKCENPIDLTFSARIQENLSESNGI